MYSRSLKYHVNEQQALAFTDLSKKMIDSDLISTSSLKFRQRLLLLIYRSSSSVAAALPMLIVVSTNQTEMRRRSLSLTSLLHVGEEIIEKFFAFRFVGQFIELEDERRDFNCPCLSGVVYASKRSSSERCAPLTRSR